MDASQLKTWAPSHLAWLPLPTVAWCRVGKHRFLEPFYEQTIEKCVQSDCFHQLFAQQTSLAELLALAEAAPGLTPSGFVFHLSRCGSTLITQLLATSPSVVALSEPGVLESVLNLRHEAAEYGFTLAHDIHVALVRAIVSALGQPRQDEKHAVIKLDAWAAHYLPLIEEAFPKVPWVFIYRDPVEILVSHQNTPGGQTIPEALPLASVGLTEQERAVLPPDAYGAWVLGKIAEAAVAARQATRAPARLIAYPMLPEAIFEIIFPLFGISLTEDEQTAMREKATYGAKSPQQKFASDSAQKQAATTERLRELANQYLMTSYQQLEALRHAGS